MTSLSLPDDARVVIRIRLVMHTLSRRGENFHGDLRYKGGSGKACSQGSHQEDCYQAQPLSEGEVEAQDLSHWQGQDDQVTEEVDHRVGEPVTEAGEASATGDRSIPEGRDWSALKDGD